jgi:hypothetical protein
MSIYFCTYVTYHLPTYPTYIVYLPSYLFA